ncbi:hypothetical protein BDD43_4081 [Mucilaginibacter gracilis]|uniref:LTXXQ motif family protein n=1 Tax=Mucilaginibacter gracilis TaxID=423350 RepID=A0A495J4F5_9SPHI|nr:hypothetical protein [Mucilaginibacter gracilis]RKR83866.1 hypothetical protein BDD43_4081 [Mucilaginibacter gracilis]
MKTRIFTLFASCFTLVFMLNTSLVFSQDIAATMKSRTPEEKAQGLTMIMKSKLNLDSAQTTKVQAINLKYAIKTDPIMKGDGGKFAKFKQLKEIQKDKNADLKAVFTADQYQQYQTLQEEMKEKIKENMKEHKQS